MNIVNAKVHFIGIGGIGMSGIAEVLANMGCKVTGSDLSRNTQTQRLNAMGVVIHRGHDPKNVSDDCDVVVYSTAVRADNPELIAARQKGIPAIQRAEMLSQLMRLKRGIAIGGSHGKTTTTSMVASMMIANQMDPTIVVGGRLDLIKSTAALGKGEWLVAEADESDGSFLRLYPEISVITNVDNDHLDHHGNADNLRKAFLNFANLVPFYGKTIFCGDDPVLAAMADEFRKRKMTYGFSDSCHLRATKVTNRNQDPSLGEFFQRFTVVQDGQALEDVNLKVSGRHNVLNALAAFGVGLELGLKPADISHGLAQYQGVDRRLQVKGEYQGSLVIDDYGHHPTEIRATLEAVASGYPHKKIIVLFQPHRFTRTRDCWDQFLNCFGQGHQVGIMDIYPAGEEPIQDIHSSRLAKAIKAEYCPTKDEAKAFLRKHAGTGHLIVIMGAGDVWKIAEELVNP